MTDSSDDASTSFTKHEALLFWTSPAAGIEMATVVKAAKQFFAPGEDVLLTPELDNKIGSSKIREDIEDDKLPCQIPMDEEMRMKKIWGQPHLQIQLYDYIVDHSQVDEVVRELREETLKMKHAVMATTLDQIPVMTMLTSLSQAKCVVDIGTFTGISALQFALTIPKDGFVITIDKSDAKLEFAKDYWRKAGVLHKIDARVGDAVDVLQQIKSGGLKGKIDLAFVDADKPSYDKYYEALLTMMKPGGLILFDNILRMARVADAKAVDEHTCCMRALNKKLYNDRRVTYTIIPSGDGIAVCQIK